MKLSILITFYNQEKYVDFTLNSIMSMNIDCDYEILIGDDGSTDNTIKLIEKWKSEYSNMVNYFVMPREKGIVYNSFERASLNRVNLLDNAKGEYVVFLDGDDFFCDSDKFIKQINILEANKKLVACASNCYYYYDDNNKKLMNQNPTKSIIIGSKKYWKNYYFHISTFVFRNVFLSEKKTFSSNNFDDNYIVYSFLKYGDIYYLNEPTSCYRQTNNGIWNNSMEVDRYVINIIDYYLENVYNQKFKKINFKRHIVDFYYLSKTKNYESIISKGVQIRLDNNNIDLKQLLKKNCCFIGTKFFLHRVKNKIKRIFKVV